MQEKRWQLKKEGRGGRQEVRKGKGRVGRGRAEEGLPHQAILFGWRGLERLEGFEGFEGLVSGSCHWYVGGGIVPTSDTEGREGKQGARKLGGRGA